MSPQTTIITEKNRDIGLSIIQALATHSPKNHFLLAARSTESGTAAVQELRKLGLQPEIDVMELDRASESSIKAAEEAMRTMFGRLDIVINSADIGIYEETDHSNLQQSYAETFNTNIIWVALMMTAFLPLMKESSPDPRIINISSARASLHLLSTGNLSPSRRISHSVKRPP